MGRDREHQQIHGYVRNAERAVNDETQQKAARLFTKFVVRVCGCEQRKIDIDIIQRSNIHQQPPHDKMAVYNERKNE